MSAFYRCAARFAAVAIAGAAVSACGSLDSASHKVASAVTPYKVEVVQGNFVSKEQVTALRPGMGRQQVRDTLGSPLLTSVFHANRWDYVFTIRRQGVEPQARRLSVFFKDDVLERFQGDEMPSEAEFVATLEPRKKTGKVPVLEASEAALQKFPAAKDPVPTEGMADQQSDGRPASSYPPLEPPRP